MSQAILETRNVTRVFGEGEAAVKALKGVSLSIPERQLTAMMGPSGSGKSTLLHILAGIDLPTAGQVLLKGTNLAELDDDRRTQLRRRQLGFIFQAFNLLPRFSAMENVALPLLLEGVKRPEAMKRAAKVLDLVGISRRADHMPGQMSGGEQQRVGIARALVIEPVLILADEPTGNLDSANSEQIMTLLRNLVETVGQTTVIVTHDPKVGAACQRVIRMKDGLVDSDTTPSPGKSDA